MLTHSLKPLGGILLILARRAPPQKLDSGVTTFMAGITKGATKSNPKSS